MVEQERSQSEESRQAGWIPQLIFQGWRRGRQQRHEDPSRWLPWSRSRLVRQSTECGSGYAGHFEADVVLVTRWQTWEICLADLQAAGVDVAAVKKMAIGAGDRDYPKPGGIGKIYIDDIRLTKRTP